MKNVNIDDIKVSSKLDDAMKNAINDGYNKKNKKNIKFKKSAIVAVMVVAIGITFFGTNFGNEVIANVRLAMSNISEYLGLSKDLGNYTTVLNESVSKNGITIQLNEVILDKDEIVVHTTIKSDTKLDETGYISEMGRIYINGKKLSNGAGGSSMQIDEYSIESVMSYNIDEDLPEGEMLVEIKYTSVLMSDTEIKGSWNFEFMANGDTLEINTNQIELNNTFILENGQKVILNEYRSNDLGQKIYYSVENKEKPYSLELRGYDDLGNEVNFYSSYESKTDGLMKNYGEISEEVKTLTLIPYVVAYPEQSGKMSNDYKQVGEEFTIEINR